MNDINAYLTFDGNCGEAMRFYEKCLKAKLEMMPFADMPNQKVSPETKDRILHARLTMGRATLMASDTMPGSGLTVGTNFSVSINCDSKQEVDETFSALTAGGKSTMAPNMTFWGAYFAMLTDKFGIQWMLNFDVPK